jgi:DNA-nicking Smr family endonuclease
MNSGKPAPKLPPPARNRPLTADEEHLWSLVSRTVRPLRRSKNPVTEGPHRAVRHGTRLGVDRAANPEPHVAIPSQRTPRASALSPILRKERQRLARGGAAIDARIDLHGMTQAEAHNALRRLLRRCQANGAKFVLVITGKGAPDASRGERGVLRRQVPMWLALPEFRRYVLGFDVADMGHGGEGALYIRLRKAKV